MITLRVSLAVLVLGATLVLIAGTAGATRTQKLPAVINMPAPFDHVSPMLMDWRGAAPSKIVRVAPDAVEMTDKHGTWIAQEASDPTSGAVLLHATDGPHLTTWVLDPTSGKVVDGPINVTGKAKAIKFTTPGGGTNTTAGLNPPGSCYLYAYPPFSFTFIIMWLDGYAEITNCTPPVGFTMALNQQLYQALSGPPLEAVGPNDVRGSGGPTGFFDHNVDAACYSGGGPWASKQHAGALIEALNGTIGVASGWTNGNWTHCNAV